MCKGLKTASHYLSFSSGFLKVTALKENDVSHITLEMTVYPYPKRKYNQTHIHLLMNIHKQSQAHFHVHAEGLGVRYKYHYELLNAIFII